MHENVFLVIESMTVLLICCLLLGCLALILFYIMHIIETIHDGAYVIML